MNTLTQSSADFILKKNPNFKPKIGMILGSGLQTFAAEISDRTVINFEEIPGFPQITVTGHQGQLSLGYMHGIPVACLQGRSHWYEGYSFANQILSHALLANPIRTLKLLGCEILIITNSSGSLRTDVPPGSLVLIKDHINFQFNNPLVGPVDDTLGSNFVSMEDAYDPELRKKFHAAANTINMTLHEGIYIGVLGPSFETPAEIRAFRLWGADVVGMSTIPEVIIARHCNLKVATISVITNFAAGLHPEKISHDITLSEGKKGAPHLHRLISGFLENYKNPC